MFYCHASKLSCKKTAKHAIKASCEPNLPLLLQRAKSEALYSMDSLNPNPRPKPYSLLKYPATPLNAHPNTPSTMDLDLPQGESLNQDFTKSVASLSSSISRLSRSSRAVPSEKDFHFYHNFEQFRSPVKEVAAASHAMLEMIGSSADIWGGEMAMAYPGDHDDGYDWVVNGNDEAYDRFDAAAEEFRGLRLKQEQRRIDSGDGFHLVCGRKKKWGQS